MNQGVGEMDVTTIYCPQCGQAMRVAPQHRQVPVACPHCQQPLEPWRFVGAANTPTPPPPPRSGPGLPPGTTEYSWRNRWVAGALGILLGPFGVHRFYLGYTGIGLIQALLTVGSVFILTPIVAIWTFVEGILCFCGAMRDIDGRPLRG